MRFESLLTSIDIKQGSIKQIRIRFGRTIFNNDVLQLRQLLSHLIVMFRESADLIIFRRIVLKQSIYILKYGFFFVFHMFAYFTHIFVEKFQYKKRDIIFRTIDGFQQLTPNGRQTKIKEIDVGLAQIVYQCRDR